MTKWLEQHASVYLVLFCAFQIFRHTWKLISIKILLLISCQANTQQTRTTVHSKGKNHSMIYFSSILSSIHQHSAVSSNARIRKFSSLNAFSVLQRAVLWLTGPSCPIQFPDSNFQHRSQKERENKIVFRSFGLIFHFLPTTKCKIGKGWVITQALLSGFIFV